MATVIIHKVKSKEILNDLNRKALKLALDKKDPIKLKMRDGVVNKFK